MRRFELSPNNREQADEVLLDDVRAVAEGLAVKKLTRDAYEAHGRFSPATVANRFGGWGRALERAGLKSARHFRVSPDDAISDMRRIAKDLGVHELTLSQYLSRGKYSAKPFSQHFGGWVNALAAAGLGASESYNPRVSEEALFENLELVWQSLGRQPTVNDMYTPRSRYSAHVYKRRFGSWRKALEAFVAASSASSTEVPRDPDAPSLESTSSASSSQPPVGRSRSIGWRLRYVVLSRDRFSCRACGRSPASHPGVRLHVDHVVPWSKGGLSVEENLQTLCEECNVGKGAA